MVPGSVLTDKFDGRYGDPPALETQAQDSEPGCKSQPDRGGLIVCDGFIQEGPYTKTPAFRNVTYEPQSNLQYPTRCEHDGN